MNGKSDKGFEKWLNGFIGDINKGKVRPTPMQKSPEYYKSQLDRDKLPHLIAYHRNLTDKLEYITSVQYYDVTKHLGAVEKEINRILGLDNIE